MHLIYRIIFVHVALSLCLPLTVIAGQDVQGTEAVAKVGNIIINQTDVDLRAQMALPMQVSFHAGVTSEKIDEIKRVALDELVVRAYKVQYAIDEEISLDTATFESAWQQKLSKNELLASNPQSVQYSKIKADLYLDLLARKAEAVAVDEKITISDQEVADYYAKNKAMYLRPRLFTASHVFVSVDPASNAEEKAARLARAEELFKRAQAGEDFYNLAYYESDDRSKYVGGSLGSFHAGQTVPEFDAAIQAMKPGEVVGPVRTMYGFHIIRLDAVEEKRQLQFEEVAPKIRAKLEEVERKQLYEKWMSGLKRTYSLEQFEQ